MSKTIREIIEVMASGGVELIETDNGYALKYTYQETVAERFILIALSNRLVKQEADGTFTVTTAGRELLAEKK